MNNLPPSAETTAARSFNIVSIIGIIFVIILISSLIVYLSLTLRQKSDLEQQLSQATSANQANDIPIDLNDQSISNSLLSYEVTGILAGKENGLENVNEIWMVRSENDPENLYSFTMPLEINAFDATKPQASNSAQRSTNVRDIPLNAAVKVLVKESLTSKEKQAIKVMYLR